MNHSDKIYSGKVEKVVAGGAGLLRTDMGVVLVPLVLPGEEIRYRLEVRQSKGVLRGILVDIPVPHSGRRSPPCAEYARCGGCDLMHAQAELQAEIKKGIFMDAMTRQGGAELKSSLPFLQGLVVRQGKEWEYRARFRFHRGQTGHAALKSRKASSTVELQDCPVAQPGIRSWLAGKPVLPVLTSGQDRRGAPRSHRGQAADEDDESSGGFRVFSAPDALFLEGEERHITIGGQAFSFGSGAFFQSNPAMLEEMLGWLKPRFDAWADLCPSGAGDAPVMADLYGGMGTFSRFMPPCGTLWMVEENPQACASARLALSGRRNARVHCGSVDTWLGKAGRLDCVIVDPPRGGLSPALGAHLCRLKPPVLIYVSCDPVTLARDAGILARGGYTVQDGALFDFYPQTWHLESVLEFRLSGARAE